MQHVARNGVGYLALFVALSGTSYAAVQLRPASVGTVHLKNGAVVSAKVKDGSIQAKDLSKNARRALKGQTGQRGPAGPPGPPGPAGGAPGGGPGVVVQGGGQLTVVRRDGSVVIPWQGDAAAASREAFASCVGNEVAVGGGARIVQSPPWETHLLSSHPWPLGAGDEPKAWRAFATNTSGTGPGAGTDSTLQVFVLCATR